MAGDKLSSMQAYLADHRLESILKDAMTVVLTHKPKRPLEFIAEALQVVQTKTDAGHTFVILDVLKELATKSETQKSPAKSGARSVRFGEPAPADVKKEKERAPSPVEHLQIKYNFKRRNSVSAEPMRPTDVKSERVIIPKTDEARGRIAGSIANNLLFRNLDSEQKQEVVDAMFERKVKAGEVVIRQGDDGDNFYVVDEGRFEVLIKDVKVVEVGEGGSFGELALMYNTPRAATVKAMVDSILWAVDRVTFQRIIMNNTFRKRKLYEEFLKTVSLLSSLENSEVVKMADALEPISFDDEEEILTQGDSGDSFYIIVDGEVVVTKTIEKQNDNGETEEETVEVNRLRKGQYFGELALLTDKPRAANVTAVGTVACVCLDTRAFIRLLGPCKDILKRNAENYARYSAIIPTTPTSATKEKEVDEE